MAFVNKRPSRMQGQVSFLSLAGRAMYFNPAQRKIDFFVEVAQGLHVKGPMPYPNLEPSPRRFTRGELTSTI
jgi:hypothetical protein